MKRTVHVHTSGLRLVAQNKRLAIATMEGAHRANMPPEDLNMVVLATHGVSVSTGALRLMAQHQVAALVLDEGFLPAALMLPMWGNTLVAERHRLQAAMTAPLKKRLWTALVEQKVKNQASLLATPDQRAHLHGLAARIKSGDPDNIEAQAARYYWPRLFARALEAPFARSRNGAPPNNLLNYGYAVLRAATARALCVAGLLPTVGLHHRNRYSTFCLADDLMEPFRPFVDRRVLGLVHDGKTTVDKEVKQRLTGVLSDQVACENEYFLLEHMLERSAASLAACIEAQGKQGQPVAKAVRALRLPQGWA